MVNESSFFGKSASSINRNFIIILLIVLSSGLFTVIAMNNISSNYHELVEDIQGMKDQTNQFNIVLLDAREFEYNFRLNANLSAQFLAWDTMLFAREILNNISQINDRGVNNVNIRQLVTDLIPLVLSYQRKFFEESELIIARGGGQFGSTNSIIGDLSEYNQKIEDLNDILFKNGAINASVYYEINSEYLLLRQHESDYRLNYESGQSEISGYLSRFNTTLLQFNSLITGYENSAVINQTISDEFHSYAANYSIFFESLVEQDLKISQLASENNEIVTSLESKTSDLSDLVQNLSNKTQSRISESIRLTVIIVVIVTLSTTTITGVIAFRTSRNLTKPLAYLNNEIEIIAQGDLSRDIELPGNPSLELVKLSNSLNTMKQQLTTLINEITTTNQTVNRGSESLAGAIEQVSASLGEMSSTAQQMSFGADQQANIQQEAMNAMDDVTLSLDQIIERINKDTELIKTISNETKFLALNARIESSRAGAAGRGFSVVADDIRNLSDRSSKILTSIEETVSEITESLRALFIQLSEKIENTTSVSEEVAASSEELAATIEEVSSSMQEISASALEMEQISETAKEKVEKFKLQK